MNKYTFRFQIGFFDTEIKEGMTMREAKDYALYRAKISGDGKCFVHGYNEKLFKWEHLFDMYQEGRLSRLRAYRALPPARAQTLFCNDLP